MVAYDVLGDPAHDERLALRVDALAADDVWVVPRTGGEARRLSPDPRGGGSAEGY